MKYCQFSTNLQIINKSQLSKFLKFYKIVDLLHFSKIADSVNFVPMSLFEMLSDFAIMFVFGIFSTFSDGQFKKFRQVWKIRQFLILFYLVKFWEITDSGNFILMSIFEMLFDVAIILGFGISLSVENLSILDFILFGQILRNC